MCSRAHARDLCLARAISPAASQSSVEPRHPSPVSHVRPSYVQTRPSVHQVSRAGLSNLLYSVTQNVPLSSNDLAGVPTPGNLRGASGGCCGSWGMRGAQKSGVRGASRAELCPLRNSYV